MYPPFGPRDVRQQGAELARLEARAGAACSEGRDTPPLFGLRILLGDDDEDAVEMLAAFLRRGGAEVMAVASAAAALDTLETARPDLIVADVAMPEVDGREMMRRVRAPGPDEGGLQPSRSRPTLVRPSSRSPCGRDSGRISPSPRSPENYCG
jgi:PleD family two-component response regulator